MKTITQMRFHWHAKKWREQTAYLSNTHRIISNKHYRAIVKMGKKVVPIILTEMSQRPDWWHHALIEITGENPVPEHHAGRLHLSIKDWILWGKERKLI